MVTYPGTTYAFDSRCSDSNSSFKFPRTVCAFCYYGVVLMTTELFEASDSRCSDSPVAVGMFKPVDTCTADCRQLNTQDYMDLLWTTLAEFPGNLIRAEREETLKL